MKSNNFFQLFYLITANYDPFHSHHHHWTNEIRRSFHWQNKKRKFNFLNLNNHMKESCSSECSSSYHGLGLKSWNSLQWVKGRIIFFFFQFYEKSTQHHQCEREAKAKRRDERGRELKYFCKWSGNEIHFSESLYARSLYFSVSDFLHNILHICEEQKRERITFWIV